MTNSLIAIFGATGPTGIHLARELLARGRRVRVISRSTANLERAFPGNGVERVAADALDPSSVAEGIAGCGVVVDCIGLPADSMDDHPVTAHNLTEATARTGARCLHVSSYWAFLPVQQLPIDEEHPRRDGNPYIRARRAAEDVFLEAGGAVVHLPDFFGPEVHTSTLQRPLEEAVAGGAMSFMGSATTEREYSFVPDAMRMVAHLLNHPEAFGRSWIVPGSGPLSPKRAARIAGDHLGREVKVRAAPSWLLRLLSAFSPDLRAFRPMLPTYTRPIRYDGSRLEAALDWLRRRAEGDG